MEMFYPCKIKQLRAFGSERSSDQE